MRILVTGANGRLGGALVKMLAKSRGLDSHTVIGVDIDDVDVTDFSVIRQYVVDLKPDLVIHCAAWTDVDACAHAPEKAIEINGYGAQNVALAAAHVNAGILYVSTNEVFDGHPNHPYYEYDLPNPINAYGYSKFVGERSVMSVNPKHYIVRTSWLFAHGGKNFIQSILQATDDGKKLRVVTDEVANPTYNDDLAEAIIKLISIGRYGIYHFTNAGACSRYTFARYVLDQAGHVRVNIEPISSREWSRASNPPTYSGLVNLTGKMVGINLRPWEEAVDAFLHQEGLLKTT